MKYKFHSLDYVRGDLEWVAKNNIAYTFMSDSNFAMHRRDKEIAEYAVEMKKRYNSPEKFRVCWGKNSDEKVFEVASILHSADMEKGITLARQSNDVTTLENIRRSNISLDTYRNLQTRFSDKGVPVYIELIVGLAGETLESWKKGIDNCITHGMGPQTSIFCYLCQILPNTEMADPEYQKKHGIRTKLVKLQEIHGSVRDAGLVQEYEELVIATNSLPYDDWREACKFSWATMLLHSMKVGFFVIAWLWDRFKIPPSALIEKYANPAWDKLLDQVSVFGEGRGQVLEEYGQIYWDVEEHALLKLSEKWTEFYTMFAAAVAEVLEDHKVKYDLKELYEVLIYQQSRMPHYGFTHVKEISFRYNTPEYFDKLFTGSPVTLCQKSQKMILQPKLFGSAEQFARETILWGRKSGTMLVPCAYENIR